MYRLFPVGILLPLTLLMSSGCTTMINGPQKISLSAPNSEKVSVSIKYLPWTPKTLTTTQKTLPTTFSSVSYHSGPVVTVDDPCYKSTSMSIPRGVNHNVWFNVFNYGIGFVIDGLLGSFWDYDRSVIVPVEADEVCVSKRIAEAEAKRKAEADALAAKKAAKKKAEDEIKAVERKVQSAFWDIRRDIIKQYSPPHPHELGDRVCSVNNLQGYVDQVAGDRVKVNVRVDFVKQTCGLADPHAFEAIVVDSLLKKFEGDPVALKRVPTIIREQLTQIGYRDERYCGNPYYGDTAGWGLRKWDLLLGLKNAKGPAVDYLRWGKKDDWVKCRTID